MKHDGIRLSPGHRRWFHITAGVLFASGAVWVVFRYGLRQPGELGDTPHPGEPWALRVHGAAAMLFLIVLGSLIRTHIMHGWNLQRNRRTGVVMITTVTVLTVTGYALYYAGGEATRPLFSTLHWVLGLGCPALLFWHIWAGRRSAR